MNIPTISRARALVDDLRTAEDLDDLLARFTEIEMVRAKIFRLRGLKFDDDCWEQEIGLDISKLPDFTDDLPWLVKYWEYAFDNTRVLVKKAGRWEIYNRTDKEI